MGVCGLYLGRREVGTVSWEQIRHGLVVQAWCPCEMGLLYRIVLQTDGGLRPLGVMLPEKELFTLRREIPAGEVPHRAFIDRMLPGEKHLPGLPLAFSAFTPGEDGLLHGIWMDMEYLLFPLRIGQCCDSAHLLCLATPVAHENQL